MGTRHVGSLWAALDCTPWAQTPCCNAPPSIQGHTPHSSSPSERLPPPAAPARAASRPGRPWFGSAPPQAGQRCQTARCGPARAAACLWREGTAGGVQRVVQTGRGQRRAAQPHAGWVPPARQRPWPCSTARPHPCQAGRPVHPPEWPDEAQRVGGMHKSGAGPGIHARPATGSSRWRPGRRIQSDVNTCCRARLSDGGLCTHAQPAGRGQHPGLLRLGELCGCLGQPAARRRVCMRPRSACRHRRALFFLAARRAGSSAVSTAGELPACNTYGSKHSNPQDCTHR